MGGRGGYSGKYSGYSADHIQRIMDRYQSVIRDNRIKAQLNPDDENRRVRQVARAAQKSVKNAKQEIGELKKALKQAQKRKRAIPF